MQPPSPSAKIVPLEGDAFQFACHPQVACFGRCCGNLTLMLLPYDVLRLTRRLGLRSEAFNERYTETVRDPDSGAPRVLLSMQDNAERTCPFRGTAGGCEVYEDRPAACRIFPLGRAAATAEPDAVTLGPARRTASGALERFFRVEEPVCVGWDEPRQWTVDEWIADQALAPYLTHNDAWLTIFTRLARLAHDPHAGQRFSAFLTAGYNLDKFRDQVTSEAFTSRFAIEPDLLAALQTDDEALLNFAVRWLRFALFGEPTMALNGTE